MKTKFVMFMIAVLLCVTPALAFGYQEAADLSNAGTLVAYLSTAIVFAATWLVRKFKPSIPGWATMFVVLGLSSALTFITNQLSSPDLSWLGQVGLGLASTFVHQLYTQIKE